MLSSVSVTPHLIYVTRDGHVAVSNLLIRHDVDINQLNAQLGMGFVARRHR